MAPPGSAGIAAIGRDGALVRQAYNENIDSLGMELDTFGFDHCMVGEALLKSWNLAESLEAAKALVTGNPVYEAGGTVEVRHLPKD